MTENKMYSQRAKQGNIPVFRGCSFNCVYCSFKRLVQMNKKCPKCAEFKPHSHLEVLSRTPPKTKDSEFVTIGLAGDISNASYYEFTKILDYCRTWDDRTFLIQSKNPTYFIHRDLDIPSNLILGTTIETNRAQIWYAEAEPKASAITDYLHYSDISKAPLPYTRYASMMKLKDAGCKLLVTAEPLLDFDMDTYISLYSWIKKLNPIFYIGYANDGKQGKRLRLPEPTLKKTLALIDALERAGIDVRRKTLRPAWFEGK